MINNLHQAKGMNIINKLDTFWTHMCPSEKL